MGMIQPQVSYEEVAEDYLWKEAQVLALIVDDDGHVKKMNPFASRLLGRTAPGLHVRDIFVDFTGTLSMERLTCAARPLSISTASRMPETLHCSFHKLDTGVLVLGRYNMREHGNLQKEVLSLNRELSNLTRELEKSNSALARLNTLKNEFLGMAAHDLRTPAGVVLSMAETLAYKLKDQLDAEDTELLNYVQSTSKEMVHLIDDFLDLSVIESGHLKLVKVPVEPAVLIAETVKLHELKAERKKVTIIPEVDNMLPLVEMDPARIRQAIGNFLSNAIEHSYQGRCVFLSCCQYGKALVVSVRDEGSGIALNRLDSIFTPYKTGETRKTAGERSCGLGLAIARKVIEEHGGQIRAENAPEGGAVFSFSLPIKEV
jgi:signal transduction histidine kinase